MILPVFGAVGDGVAVGGAITFIGLIASYAMVLIRRGDRKEKASYDEMRQERDLWRSAYLTGEAPADAPDHLKALIPPKKEHPDV